MTIAAEDTVEHAAVLMYTRGLKRLPVVETAGRLAGIISRADVLAAFDRPDEEIRAEIISQVIPRLSEPSWYSVNVKDGIVTVEGSPGDRLDRPPGSRRDPSGPGCGGGA